MENLTVWNYNNSEVRTVTVNNEPWFVGKDVADILGYSNSSKAVSTHVDNEDKQFLMIDIADSQNGNVPVGQSKTAIINESGLYSLILSSKLPTAKQFKRWVTSEVLPAIRKTGEYKVTKSQPNSETAKMRAEAMLLNAKNRTAKQMLKLWSDAGIKPQYQALSLNNYYDGLEIPRIAFKDEVTALYDATTIASHLGVMSKSGKPHAQAIGAIIEKLKPLEANEWAMTPYSRNGHDDESIQYAVSVEKKVADWLIENNYPTVIKNKCKNFSVLYKERDNTP